MQSGWNGMFERNIYGTCRNTSLMTKREDYSDFNDVLPDFSSGYFG
jgi:hypothetical protein